MKKLFYLISFALLVACCSKDDATPSYIDNKLIGKWELEYYYRDDDNNPINIDNAENYTKLLSAPHYVIFNADTACGFRQDYIIGYYINSYTIEANKIKLNKLCEYLNLAGIVDYFMETNLHYKIRNNQLIIGSNSWNYSTQDDCVIYGFYKRKS
ncbi:MAG: hypothetical protein LBJ63_04595 [Prevotellaceae bacterium]|jgi:hypothetical protein|nr:hypothetical protein [Prevotellaceae bacterium]